jgi:hypothetical protein
LFVHFEMVPDRLPDGLRDIIARFPPGALQFEVGIQTFNAEVSKLISRRQNYDRLAENLRFLRQHTGVHVHADLIAGLPGETLDSFGEGFDRLVALGPQEIQVGILKRLRGTPIVRHDQEWKMVYAQDPPYEILQNKLLDFATAQRLRRFSRYWDIVANSGNFVQTIPLLWNASGASPFGRFLDFSDWLYDRLHRTDSISLAVLAEQLFGYLTTVLDCDSAEAARAILEDYQRPGRHDIPEFLRAHANGNARTVVTNAIVSLPKRQSRHVARAPASISVAGPG